jgi:two-component system chemotaxis response regulator CheY
LARKILLADDSVTAQNMGRKILADAGYEVITVNNGSAALKKIAETKPDLIVLDVYMPGYSGLEVCQRLKEVQETSRIPVLLTVGKLEPFKPEEAKRVRAEGFIVKPFEASELLGALAKLEEKIVPRQEASKPGRFARAVAAVEEGRYDKTMAVEEDAGWKDRIAFPTGKKKKAAEEESADDPAIYNPINRDLRTVVEQHRAPAPQEEKAEVAHLDLGALAPEGLPKDVTAEEIAALAAAAAQVKGIIEGKTADPPPAERAAVWEDAKIDESRTEEAKTEDQPEAKDATPPVADSLNENAPGAATLAEEKPKDQIEAPVEKPVEAAKDEAGQPAPSHAELMAAISALEPEVAASTNSGNGLASHASEKHSTDEPVTMAVVAGAESSPAVSRWTAVAVAVDPEETAISLEQEMQKVQVALAAEAAHAEMVAAFAKTQPMAAVAFVPETTPAPVEAAAPEPVAPAPAIPEPELTQTASVSASSATEAIRAAVREFETVEVSRFEAQPPAPAETEPAPAQASEPVSQPAAEVQPVPEAKAEEQVVEQTATEPAAATQEIPAPVQEEPKLEELKQEDPKHEEHRHEEPAPVVAIEPPVAMEFGVANPEKIESTAPLAASEVPAEQISSGPAPSDQVSSEAVPVAPVELAAEVTASVPNKESEIAETTAAAWASWRRIRESGDSKVQPVATKPSQEEVEKDAPKPPDSAAMAVAAGAEKAPEEIPAAPESESEEIANIVDSVLADMRPKIVAEISKKLGKKK